MGSYMPEHGDVIEAKIGNKVMVGRVHSVTYIDGRPTFVRVHTIGENLELEVITVPVSAVTKL